MSFFRSNVESTAAVILYRIENAITINIRQKKEIAYCCYGYFCLALFAHPYKSLCYFNTEISFDVNFLTCFGWKAMFLTCMDILNQMDNNECYKMWV